MSAGPSFASVSLEGYARMRGLVLDWPVDRVARLLPMELSLGRQALTAPGTHPVVLFFYDVIDAHMSVPLPLPPLTYREHIVGVPYTYATCGDPRCDGHGPLFYMPTLRLDNVVAVGGGVVYWGFNKSLADVVVTERYYEVFEPRGERLLSFDFEALGDYGPVDRFPHVERLRDALDQPVVCRFPMARGSYVAASAFERRWSDAGVRALRGRLTLDREYERGILPGEYGIPGVDASPLGGFEIATHWRLGLPFPVTEL